MRPLRTQTSIAISTWSLSTRGAWRAALPSHASTARPSTTIFRSIRFSMTRKRSKRRSRLTRTSPPRVNTAVGTSCHSWTPRAPPGIWTSSAGRSETPTSHISASLTAPISASGTPTCFHPTSAHCPWTVSSIRRCRPTRARLPRWSDSSKTSRRLSPTARRGTARMGSQVIPSPRSTP